MYHDTSTSPHDVDRFIATCNDNKIQHLTVNRPDECYIQTFSKHGINSLLVGRFNIRHGINGRLRLSTKCLIDLQKKVITTLLEVVRLKSKELANMPF